MKLLTIAGLIIALFIALVVITLVVILLTSRPVSCPACLKLSGGRCEPITDAHFKTQIGYWMDERTRSSVESVFGHISDWDTSLVTDMSSAFEDRESFNEDIGCWDTSKVLRMDHMFSGASSFNQDISGWCVTRFIQPPKGMFTAANKMTPEKQPKWGHGYTCT